MAQAYSVKLSVNEIYSILLDYFSTQYDIKIRSFVKPSSIEVDIGSWTTIRRGNPPGTVKIILVSKGKESQIEFNFSFGTWFFVVTIIFASLFFIFLLLRLIPLLVGHLVLALFVFTLTMPDDVDKGKKSSIDRVINFLKEKKCIVEEVEKEKPP